MNNEKETLLTKQTGDRSLPLFSYLNNSAEIFPFFASTLLLSLRLRVPPVRSFFSWLFPFVRFLFLSSIFFSRGVSFFSKFQLGPYQYALVSLAFLSPPGSSYISLFPLKSPVLKAWLVPDFFPSSSSRRLTQRSKLNN